MDQPLLAQNRCIGSQMFLSHVVAIHFPWQSNCMTSAHKLRSQVHNPIPCILQPSKAHPILSTIAPIETVCRQLRVFLFCNSIGMVFRSKWQGCHPEQTNTLASGPSVAEQSKVEDSSEWITIIDLRVLQGSQRCPGMLFHPALLGLGAAGVLLSFWADT